MRYLRESECNYLKYSKRRVAKIGLTQGQYVDTVKILRQQGILTNVSNSNRVLYKVNKKLL